MKRTYAHRGLVWLLVGVLVSLPAAAQAPAAQSTVRTEAVRAHMEFLAGEALQGRGSGTRDEHIAVSYAAAQMRMMGVEPAGDEGGYIQTIEVERAVLAGPPVLSVAGSDIRWTHGQEMLALQMAEAEISGPLVKVDLAQAAAAQIERGSVVLLTGRGDEETFNRAVGAVLAQEATALVAARPQLAKQWEQRAQRPLRLPARVGGVRGQGVSILALKAEAFKRLQQTAEGTVVRIAGAAGETERSQTWNAVGRIPGSDARLKDDAVLLSAHIDHLGVRGERLYYGADDDASGVTAVLELARALAAGPRPRRTLLFALYGSEEAGGLGSRYFIQNPPLPLQNLVANLQFEMIGRPDPNVPEGVLWLTGYERSDLGAALSERGAPLVADPYPEQNFFMRSDNYRLAQQGVVAHTVSSFGMHADYHQPTDTVERIDFAHMARAIASLVEPVRWLVNSEWQPQWVEGGRP